MIDQGSVLRLTGASVAIAALVLTAGCAAEEQGDAENVQFSLTYSIANDEDSPYALMAQKYMEQNPGVTIEINEEPFEQYGQTLRTYLQAGNASDVIQTTPGYGQLQSAIALAEAGFLLPLDTTLSPEVADLFSYDGATYGQPIDMSATGIMFADATAEAAGVDIAETTEGLIEQCPALTDAGMSYFALAGGTLSNAGLMALVISATRVYAEEPDWNARRSSGEVSFESSPGWAETLNTVIELNEAGCFQPGAAGSGFEAITGGIVQGTSLAAFIPGSRDLQRAAPDAGLTVRAFPPADARQDHIFVSPISGLSVATTAQQPDAAKAFVAWMAEPEQSAEFAELAGTLPATFAGDPESVGSLYEPIVPLLSEGAYSPLPRASWPNSAVYDELSSGAQGLLTGQLSVEEVLRSLDTAWDQGVS